MADHSSSYHYGPGKVVQIGKKKAVICGISYKGMEEEIKGSINDANCMKYLLTKKFKFSDSNIRMLTDAEEENSTSYSLPTKENILRQRTRGFVGILLLRTWFATGGRRWGRDQETATTGAMTFAFIRAIEHEEGSTYGMLLNSIRSCIRNVSGEIGFGLVTQPMGLSLAERRPVSGHVVRQEPQLTSNRQFNVYTKPFAI